MTLRKSEWRVWPCANRDVQQLVQAHHYSKGYGTIGDTYQHGLFRVEDQGMGRCWGIAAWRPAIFLIKRFGGLPLMLSRFALLPEAPANAASFLLRHSMRLIDRTTYPVLVTYADEGQGHTGTMYAAAGWTLDGYGGHVTYLDEAGRQIPSMNDGHFVKPEPGWRTIKNRKSRWLHLASAASSDAPGIQPEEGGSQPTPTLQLWDLA
jgi:hypothetical protein